MYMLQLYWFTKILAGILKSLGIEDLSYPTDDLEDEDDTEEEDE